jgi:hypothetical protein
MNVKHTRRTPNLVPVLEELHVRPIELWGVLSVYLDTSPARVLAQDDLRYVEARARELRLTLQHDALPTFDAAVETVERHLTNDLPATRPGLAVFATADPSSFRSVPLPRAPHQQMVWDRRPHISPLQVIVDDYERVALALFDAKRARLFTVFLGDIEAQVGVNQDRSEQGARSQDSGGSPIDTAWKSESALQRHVDRTIAMLSVLLRAHPFERLFVAGPDPSATARLVRNLPKPLRDRIAGTFELDTFADDAAILRAVLERADLAERRAEWDAIRKVKAAAQDRLVATGARVLDAVNDGRVQTLYIGDLHGKRGWECEQCGRLDVQATTCPACGQPMIFVQDIHERIVERALDQGAIVETVTGDAAAELAALGDLGAWLRF